MTITAKYSTICPCCNARINAGEKVEWTKGSKARHVACAGKPGAVSAPSAAPRKSSGYGRRRGTWTGCSCGSVAEYSKENDCWSCKHDAE